ncbi:MAG: hypothetical protein ACYC56_01465 [Candidatus Aquicultor sp.]
MTDFESAILHLEGFSDEEWDHTRKMLTACREPRYCRECCSQKCSVADFLEILMQENGSREQTLGSLKTLIDSRSEELGNRPIYCLDQGFCALYCISACPIGRIMRALTKELAHAYEHL